MLPDKWAVWSMLANPRVLAAFRFGTMNKMPPAGPWRIRDEMVWDAPWECSLNHASAADR